MKSRKSIRLLEPIRKQRAIEIAELTIRKKIFQIFYKVLLKDIIDIVKQDTSVKDIKNSVASNPLLVAIKNNQISYRNNKFYGKFNASIIKELKAIGAVFSAIDHSYFLMLPSLPSNVKQAIMRQDQNNITIVNKLESTLDTLPQRAEEIHKNINLAALVPLFLKIVSNLDKQVTSNIRTAKKTADTLDKDLQRRLAEQYTNNMALYIQNFTSEEITKFRTNLIQKVKDGAMPGDLMKDIQHTYNVSKNKAEFLAGQEVRLLTSVYQSERYKSSGINKLEIIYGLKSAK